MLIYTLNDDGLSYSAAEETDASVTRVEVPDTYNGLPVTEISAIFNHCSNLEEIIAGHNVRDICHGSLDFPSLKRLYLGKGIEKINGPLNESGNFTDIFYSGTEDEWQNVRWFFVDDQETVIGKINKHFGILGKSVILSFDEEKLFPYTHWDCIKGKPEAINSEKVSYENSISGLEANNVKDAIDKLNAKHFDATALSSWKELLHLVRSGKAHDFIKIGDQLVSVKDGKELVWDVIGIDADVPVEEKHKHSVTLQLRDCYIVMPFSVPEASYFSVTRLAPGQYYLKMNNYSSASKYYAFTLDEELPLGGLIRISQNKVYLYRTKTENYYKSFDVDLSSENEEDMSGTLLEQENYHIHTDMGNVNYEQSDIRKWLNSAEVDWWYHSNGRSLAPLDYLSIPGFCKDMDEDFLSAINPVKKKTVNAEGTEVITEDKFFLLSAEEVYARSGNWYEYYQENSSLSSSGVTEDSARIKMYEAAPCTWVLRTTSGDRGYMRVLTNGSVSYVKAAKVNTFGIAPACCIC